MKKGFVLTFISLLGIFLLSGCTSKKNYLNIEADGNRTTGFTWEYTIEDPSLIELTGNDYKVSSVDLNLVGAPGMYYWTFTPLKKGTTTINFSYARPWEEVAPESTASVTISIDENLKIEVVSSNVPSTKWSVSVSDKQVASQINN